MKLERPVGSTLEIEKARQELDNAISIHGLTSTSAIKKSQNLDEIINLQMDSANYFRVDLADNHG